MIIIIRHLPRSKAATLSCLEPHAISSNHSPELKINNFINLAFSFSTGINEIQGNLGFMRWHRNLLLRSSQWWRTPGEVLIPSQSRWWSRPSPEEKKTFVSKSSWICRVHIRTTILRMMTALPFLLGPRSPRPQSLGRSKQPRSNCTSLSTCQFLHLLRMQ